MVFNEKSKGMALVKPKTETKVRIDLEPEREHKLQVLKEVYTTNVKKVSRTKLIKMAIDNLIADVEKQASEEEGLEYLRSLYKEAEF